MNARVQCQKTTDDKYGDTLLQIFIEVVKYSYL
jgi:hypothetical protein